ncbi:hypothetical protein COUCH_26425 [Couchioplanes caeruleus]|uniref:hypothetical protein n=1 Tax=Couchioplanes caeruleus TaxID=56438 RepID=UPI0020BF9704|nr:hypothetical protein [Couchioplanes caeruleus]UQU62553.1 hypothetical protein COUCH_26425 [Couchioplanes caeruleus]
MVLQQVGAWVLEELPRLNLAILRDELPPGAMREAVRTVVLPRLPLPGRWTPAEARQMLVNLGFIGASVARHYQERTPGGKETPEVAFQDLEVGAEGTPFRAYFAAVADRTGTGHDHRDSYASLVRWNVGTIEVRLGGELLTVLPGEFGDGRIRSYTGSGGEERFFTLVKKGEAIELAVNDLLEPLTASGTQFCSEEALSRVRTAVRLLQALRQMFVDFASLPPDRSMPPEHFLDVFRQFAVHWTPGDIPPSGALDPEALKRDFLLGIAIDDYDRHVRRLFPGLLTREREALETLMARPTLPQQMAASLGVDLDALRHAGPAEVRRLLSGHPVLVDWYALLAAHARAAGAHLMLSKRFLFNPQHRRDAEGIGDRPLVSNRSGTTGMTETFLERLTRARREHVLAPLRRAVSAETANSTIAGGVRSRTGRAAPVEVLPVS